jgi:flagellar biosynthesis chaperone FliJ
MKKIFGVIFVALIVLTSCKKSENYSEMQFVSDPSAKEEGLNSNEKSKSSCQVVSKKKIIRDGEIRIEVQDVKPAKAFADSVIRSVQGYCDEEKLINDDYRLEYTLKIRIPSEKLDEFISKIEKGEGVVSSKSLNARDVTDQFIDMETRLRNKEKYMTRYQELLKNAKSIKDVLNLQENIRGLEEEIESTKGKLNYLNDQVNYSTIILTINQRKVYSFESKQRNSFWNDLKSGFVNGWYNFVGFIVFLVNIWLFILFISMAVFFWIRFRKRKRNKKSA